MLSLRPLAFLIRAQLLASPLAALALILPPPLAALEVEVQPATLALAAGDEGVAVLRIFNPGSALVEGLDLEIRYRGGAQIEHDALPPGPLFADAEFAVALWVKAPATEPASGAAEIRIRYREKPKDEVQLPIPRVVFTTLSLTGRSSVNLAETVNVDVDLRGSGFNELREGRVNLTVTNVWDRPFTRVTVTYLPDRNFLITDESPEGPASLAPGEQRSFVFVVEPYGDALHGEHLLVFLMALGWQEAGQAQTGQRVVRHPFSVAPPGGVEILEILRVPIFLLPGFVIVGTFRVSAKRRKAREGNGEGGKPKELNLKNFSMETLCSIALSLIVAGLYPVITGRNFLRSYGFHDIFYLYVGSFAVGMLAAGAVRLWPTLRRKLFEPEENDSPQTALRKAAFSRASLARVDMPFDGASTKTERFFVYRQVGEHIWLAPEIRWQWQKPDESYDTFADEVQDLMQSKRESFSAWYLWKLSRHLASARKKKLIDVFWETVFWETDKKERPLRPIRLSRADWADVTMDYGDNLFCRRHEPHNNRIHEPHNNRIHLASISKGGAESMASSQNLPPMTLPIARDCRFTLIWVKTFQNPGLLASRKSYRSTFEQARKPDGDWQMPWPTFAYHPRQEFWGKYLETRGAEKTKLEDLTGLSAYQAEKHLMPLRLSLQKSSFSRQLATGETCDKKTNLCACWVEGYAYPHGIAVLLTFRWRGRISLDQAVDHLIELRQGRYSGQDSLLVKERGGRTAGEIATDIGQNLTDLSKGSLSDKLGEPFVISTVVEAEGANPLVSVTEKRDLYQALAGLATLGSTKRTGSWRNLPLPQAGEAWLQLANGTKPGEALYAIPRARVIWLPRHFADQPQEAHGECSRGSKLLRLGRYHRNLVLATMQTEYLLRFVGWAKQQWSRNILTVHEQWLVWKAAGALGRLFGGRKANTYCTKSVWAQIALQEALVNSIREDRCKMSPLFDTRTPPKTPARR